MFSTGQLIFAALFVLFFSVVIVFSYRKDKKLHNKNYKGVKWVGIVFILFIIFLFTIKYLLKN
jgi:mannose/fructose/N-acetylgalactosamine-specific phosphotransferase system component IIC